MINIDRLEASTSGPIQGAIHEKTPEQVHVSIVESEKGPKEEKITRKTITDNEKTLINRFKDLAESWEKVTEIVFENRHQYLSRGMIKHYEVLHEKAKLKDRIRNYLQRERRDGGKGTD